MSGCCNCTDKPRKENLSQKTCEVEKTNRARFFHKKRIKNFGKERNGYELRDRPQSANVIVQVSSSVSGVSHQQSSMYVDHGTVLHALIVDTYFQSSNPKDLLSPTLINDYLISCMLDYSDYLSTH